MSVKPQLNYRLERISSFNTHLSHFRPWFNTQTADSNNNKPNITHG